MKKMQVASIAKYGKNEKLNFQEIPIPSLKENDILVKVCAASLNPIDFKIRDGKIKFLKKYSFPLVLGHDVSGVVTEVGSHVSRFKKGDKIFARQRDSRIGTLAEYISIDETEAAHMPKNLNFEQAASIPLVGLTSWQALNETARVKRGDRVFIQAGSGGVGTFAIQLAKHLGAYVITTTSQRNVELVRRLGADEVIDYKTQKFNEVLKDIDVVFDTLGGESLYQSFQIVRPGGFVVSISGDPDGQTAKDMGLGFFKQIILSLVGLKVNLLAQKFSAHYRFIFMKPAGDQLEKIAKLIENETIKPVIDKIFTFQESQQAMDYLESGRASGKVVVSISV